MRCNNGCSGSTNSENATSQVLNTQTITEYIPVTITYSVVPSSGSICGCNNGCNNNCGCDCNYDCGCGCNSCNSCSTTTALDTNIFSDSAITLDSVQSFGCGCNSGCGCGNNSDCGCGNDSGCGCGNNSGNGCGIIFPNFVCRPCNRL